MLKVFAVFDNKAASYGTPVFQATVGLAVRIFEDACANPQSPLCVHSADYSLFELGSYDPNSGQLISLPQPSFVVSAASVVANRVQRAVEPVKVEVTAQAEEVAK